MPRRSGSTSGEPACAHASRAATIANCSQRSRRRACTRSIRVAGSAAAHAAIRAGSSAAQSSVSWRTPLRPASSDSQVLATSAPTGVIAPRPVTTTRVRSVPTILRSSSWGDPALRGGQPPAGSEILAVSVQTGSVSGGDVGAPDVVDYVLHRLEVLELVVGDLDAELVLRRHGDLHHRQRVDVEVVHERLVRGDLIGGHASNLVDDLAETRQDFLLRHGHWSSALLLRLLRCACCGSPRRGVGQGTVITCAA